MFALFFSLYYAMFKGSWSNYTYNDLFAPGTLNTTIKNAFAELGTFITSIFGDNQMTNFGENLLNGNCLMTLISLALALITSIGIVVMAVKGVKKAFGIFFGQIR